MSYISRTYTPFLPAEAAKALGLDAHAYQAAVASGQLRRSLLPEGLWWRHGFEFHSFWDLVQFSLGRSLSEYLGCDFGATGDTVDDICGILVGADDDQVTVLDPHLRLRDEQLHAIHEMLLDITLVEHLSGAYDQVADVVASFVGPAAPHAPRRSPALMRLRAA